MRLQAAFGVVAVITAMQVSLGESVPTLSERDDLKDLSARWQGAMATFDVSGLAVAVVKDGKAYAIEGWGVCSPNGPAPDADTKFYIASITKTYTATAICKLASEGKLSLSDPVVKYLPRFKLSEPGAEKITIQDLLCHAQGIDCAPVVWLDAFTGEINDDRYFALLEKFGKASGKVDYSNVHFTLLGRVIEAVTGKSWRDYLRGEILGPSGMTRTSGYMSERRSDSNFAVPMRLEGATWKEIEPWKTDETMHAAGGLDSTASDMARWVCLNVNDGKADGKQVLKPGVASAMLVERSTLEKPDGSLRIMTGFGDAWNLGTFKGHPIASHGGGYAGTSAYVLLLPKDNAGFVVLMNSMGLARGLGDVIAIDLLERLTGEKAGGDILAAMNKRAKMMKERGLPREGPCGKLAAADLPAGADAWAGKYANADFGTLTVARTADGVEFHLGSSPLDVSAKEGGFVIGDGSLFQGSKGEFVMKNGTPIAIRIQEPSVGVLVFEKLP